MLFNFKNKQKYKEYWKNIDRMLNELVIVVTSAYWNYSNFRLLIFAYLYLLNFHNDYVSFVWKVEKKVI